VLADVLAGRHGADAPEGCVISTGGGIVETPCALEMLEGCDNVIWIHRHIEDVAECLEGEGSWRPSLGEPCREVFARREKWYEQCSNYVFTVRQGDNDWNSLDAEFLRLLRHILSLSGRETAPVSNTFMLSLSFPSVEALVASGVKQEIFRGADVVELRADLMDHPSDVRWMREQLALLRRHTFAPLVFTLRSTAEGGRFAGGREETVAILQQAIKAGCEVVDVEARLENAAEIASRRGCTKLIGSFHDFHRCLSTPELEAKVRQMCEGVFDIAKVVMMPNVAADVITARHTAACLQKEMPPMKLMLLLMGDAGKLSRVLNPIYTPVTHAAMPFKAAPGQMSASEIVDCRRTLGLQAESRRFFVFGSLPCLTPDDTEDLYEPHCVEEIMWKLSLASTGGAALSGSYTKAIVHHLEVTRAAGEVGAVDVITKDPAGRLQGDNSQWAAVAATLAPHFQGAVDGVALVFGGGLAARAARFALVSLGFDVLRQGAGDAPNERLTSVSSLTVVVVACSEEAHWLEDVLKIHKPFTVLAPRCWDDVQGVGVDVPKMFEQAEAVGCTTISEASVLLEQGRIIRRCWAA